ncbi:MAG: retropepsin-like aspartic protease [Sedimenticola sp.]
MLAHIGGSDVNCLIDTGSTLSVLHPNRYEAIPEDVRPMLKDTHTSIRMADGGLVKLQGKATFTVMINGATFRQEMVVADIEVPAVIGYDFLHCYNCQIDVGQHKRQESTVYARKQHALSITHNRGREYSNSP